MRKRGTGTIEQPGGRFRVRLTTPEGRASLGVFDTPEEADAVLYAARYELGQIARSEGLTLEAWGVVFLDRREREGYRSVADDRRRWKLHVAGSALSRLALRSIRPRDVRAWMDVISVKLAADRRGRRRLTKRSLDNILNLVRAALASAMDRDIIDANPAQGVRSPRREAPTHEPWTHMLLEEQRAVFACVKIPRAHMLMIAFAIGTGLRQGEQFNLRLVDVHLEGPRPHIVVRRGSKTGGPKSTRGKIKIRRVPLFGVGLESTREWLALLPIYARKNPLGLVFPGPAGARRQKGKHLHFTRRDPLTKKPRPFDPLPGYLAAAGIVPEKRHDQRPVRWHDLRHTFGSSCVSGVWGRAWSLEQLQVVMGHESITTTQRYAHLAEDAVWAVAGRMDEPALSPRLPRVASAEPLQTQRDHSQNRGSHLRDLNSRPTVYEPEALCNDPAAVRQWRARARALEALEGLARRDGELAGAIITELALAGDVPAKAALAELAAGRWARSVDVLIAVGEEQRAAGNDAEDMHPMQAGST